MKLPRIGVRVAGADRSVATERPASPSWGYASLSSLDGGARCWHDHAVNQQGLRVVMRDLAPSDAGAIIEAWTAPGVPGFMDDFGPRARGEVKEWLPAAIAARAIDPRCGDGAIVERSSGHLVGWIGWGGSSERHRDIGDIDVAYVVAPGSGGRGVLVDYCFSELGVSSFWGRCHPDNIASRRVDAALQAIGEVDREPAIGATVASWASFDRPTTAPNERRAS